jgi:hypothetical protein
MSDEQWLRDGLVDAVPDPPEAPGRAAAAEDRARRTRRRTATAAALLGTAGVVAVVAVAVSVLGPADPGTDPAGPVASDTPAPADIPDCPPAPEGASPDPMDEIDPSAPDAVPPGAQAVRLCQGPGTEIEVPDDPLLTDVQGLADLVNDLPKTGEPEMCTNELGPGYRLVFSYPDGSTFVVSSQQYGCRLNVVGSTYRSDADAPWEGFKERLKAQQEDAT